MTLYGMRARTILDGPEETLDWLWKRAAHPHTPADSPAQPGTRRRLAWGDLVRISLAVGSGSCLLF
jgi:hypothetical protein